MTVFLLDAGSFSFIIFEMLYTSFKLNIAHLSSALPPGPPNPLWGSQCTQTHSRALFPSSCKTQNLFLSWLIPWCPTGKTGYCSK